MRSELEADPKSLRRCRAWLLVGLGLVALIVGAKAYVILQFGSDVPFSDQWAKEGGMIIEPYYQGRLRLADFFVPHSEHRIAPTLAINLLWVICSGQWDARVQCVANAFLAAALAAGLAAFAWRRLSPGWGLAVAWVLAGLGVLPLVWENTLEGFQSVFYFLMGFSLAAIYGMMAPGGARTALWWLGLVCAGLAGVSLGSGFLCAAPVALVMALRLLSRRPFRGSDLATLVVSFLLLLVGWHFRAAAPWHETLHSHSLAQFMLFAVRCLAWPCPQWPALAALIWLPWAVFVVVRLRRQTLAGDLTSEFIFAAGVWVLLQVAGLAYSRGTSMAGVPSNRYGDLCALSYPVNLMAWYGLRSRRMLVWPWMAGLAAAAVVAVLPAWNGMLPALRYQYNLTDSNVRGYVLTGDPGYLKAGQIPFPIPDTLGELLRRPVLRDILPVSVHRPPARESGLSRAVRWFCREAGWITGLGLAALILGTLSWRTDSRFAGATLPRSGGSSPPGSG